VTRGLRLADPANGADHDLPAPTGPVRTYVLASSPRTGSTLLARWIAATGRAGDPKEYLNPMQIRDWEARLAPTFLGRWAHRALVGPLVNLAGHGRWTDARLRQHLDRVRARRSCAGWFGLKLHAHHRERWFDEAGRDAVAWLDAARWILVERDDELAQAVSWARARRSGRWVAHQPSHLPDVYDRAAIHGRLTAVRAARESWARFFDAHAVEPLRIGYEALVADPAATVGAALRFLDVSDSVALGPPPLARQADATSAAWIARYRAEAGVP